MPEVLLNTAGKTRTTGTADPVILGGTGKSGSFADVADGTEIAYYRRYASGKEGFENAIGIWRVQVTATSIGYIDRTSVSDSSNGGAAVSWGVGLQLIDATITPSMLVLDDDARLETVEPGDLGAADSIDGTETWIALQGTDGIDITAQEVSGDPMLQQKSLANNRSRGFTQFERLLPIQTGTNGALVAGESFVFYGSGAGAAGNLQTTYYTPCLNLVVTNTNDTAMIQHTNWPLPFYAGVNDYDQRWAIIIPTLTTDAQDFELEIGFTNSTVAGTVPCTQGIFFATIDNVATWQLRVRNAAGTRTVDTGITVTTGATVLRVKYDAALVKSRFWLNGTELTSILDSERAVDFLTRLGMSASIRKINSSGGALARSVVLFAHKYDNKKDGLPNFT